MSDHEDKNEITPDPLEAVRKQGQVVAGALKEMLGAVDSWMSANLPTIYSSPSSSQSGIKFDPKPSETDENPASSSSSETALSSTSRPLSETDPVLAEELRQATSDPERGYICPNCSGLNGKHSGMDECPPDPTWVGLSPKPIPFADTLRKRKTDKRRPVSREKKRIAEVTMKVYTYGSAKQKSETVERMVHDMEVKGYRIMEVETDGKTIR